MTAPMSNVPDCVDCDCSGAGPVVWSVRDVCGPIAGQAVTQARGGATVATATTDTDGRFALTDWRDGDALEVTRTHYTSYSGGAPPLGEVTLEPAGGYHVLQAGIALPTVLDVTWRDGSSTLTFDPAQGIAGAWAGGIAWTGLANPDCSIGLIGDDAHPVRAEPALIAHAVRLTTCLPVLEAAIPLCVLRTSLPGGVPWSDALLWRGNSTPPTGWIDEADPYWFVYGLGAVICTDPFSIQFGDLELGEGGLYPYSGSITAPGSPSLSRQVCATARRPSCGGTPGAVVPGAAVAIYPGTGTTATGTCTAGSGGRCCLTVTDPGTYRVEATDAAGGVGVAWVSVGACSDDQEVPVEVCGGAECLDVTGLYADDAGTTTPLDAATVTIDELPELAWTTDSAGRACVELTTAQMLRLAPVAGSICATRRGTVRIAKAGWLERCLPVDFICGSSLAAAEAAPEAVTLSGLSYPPAPTGSGLDRYNRTPETICPDDCSVAGLIGRNVVPVGLAAALTAPIAGGPDVLGSLSGVVVPWLLDATRLDTGASAHGSPFPDVGPEVEYYAEGTGTFDPGGCFTTYNSYKAWWNRAAQQLVWDWYGTGWTGNPAVDCPDSLLPGSVPDCPECSSGTLPTRRLRLTLDTPGWSPCLPGDYDHSGTYAGGGGLGRALGYTIGATEAPEP
jgi:hypothetical protein